MEDQTAQSPSLGVGTLSVCDPLMHTFKDFKPNSETDSMVDDKDDDTPFKIELEKPVSKAPAPPRHPNTDNIKSYSASVGNPAPGHSSSLEKIEVSYGGFWIRFAAILVDAMIVMLATGLVLKASEKYASVLMLLYNSVFHSSAFQATPGKLLFGLRVVDLSYEKISLGRSVGRSLASVLSGLLFSLGFLIAAFSREKRSLHDFISGSYVIRHRSTPRAMTFVVIFLCLFIQLKIPYFKNFRTRETLAKSINPSVKIDSCSGKQYCVVTYVTPWCPACQSGEPFMIQVAQFLKPSSKVGYKIIVGYDEPENLNQKAASLGDLAMIDIDGSVREKLKIRSFPKWLVWDEATKKVIHSPIQVVFDRTLNDQEMESMLPEFLNLPKDQIF